MESDRPAIFKHITERFGEDKTARVASFGTMQGRKVIEEIGRYLAAKHNDDDGENPWSIPNVARIKKEFDSDPEKTKEKYPEMFYYYDGLLDTKISQSVHPAGMVISPITLPDNFGVFDKDNELCLFLDMDNIHDYTGLAKYDFLVLSTVQVIRDTCRYIGIPYPKTHEINWDDKKVWDDMIKNPAAIFQFEGTYSHDCLKRFKPQNIFDMSLVTACVRPSGASYRDELLARKPHKNPSAMIDELLKDNYGYLIFQEDTIKFLQDICGLSGSEADNIRRAIGRKQRDRLDKAMPSILEGYCNKSTQPREIAKQEAKEFLQILEDSAEYQFGKNHSIAYCLLGYLCAYFRYYYPYEFITAVLNTFSDDAEKTATIVEYAQGLGIKIFPPRWGVSKEIYSFDKERKIIAKDLTSIKFISASLAKELYEVSHMKKYESFPDVLDALKQHTSIDSRQLNILIRLDFFQEIDGNAKRLLRITKLYDELSDRTQFMKEKLDSDMFEIVKAHSRETAKKFVDCDMPAIKQECFKRLSNADIPDFSIKEKIADQREFLGYVDIRTGKPEDVRKVLVTGVFPLKSQRTGNVWAYAFNAVSVGTGKANHWTCKRMVYKTCEFREGDIIYIDKYHKEREQYWHVDSCHRVA